MIMGRIYLLEIRAKESSQARWTHDKREMKQKERKRVVHPSVSSSKLHLRINKEGGEACAEWIQMWLVFGSDGALQLHNRV